MPLKTIQGLFIVLLIIVLPLFAHLDHLPIQLWDESRLAVNALEMSQNGDMIVTSFNGEPDMWNTKPPFLIWIQSLFLHIFGLNELAIRLPSAIAAALTCIVLYLFMSKTLKASWLGIISVLMLITTEGYMRLHGTRTGDYDAMMVLMMTGYALSYFLFLEKGKIKYLYATFIFLTLAVLTKSVAGLLFLPALFLYSFYQLKIKHSLRTPHFYIGLAGFLLLVVGYYLLREHFNPGYIQAVRENELGGRFNTVIEGHQGDAWFYYDWIRSDGFSKWYLLVIPGILCGVFSKDIMMRKFTIFSMLVVITHLIIISSAASKLPWYEMACYPFLSFLSAIFLYTAFSMLSQPELWKTSLKINILPVAILFMLFYNPYMSIIDKVFHPSGESYNLDNLFMGYFFKDILDHKKNVEGFTLVSAQNDYNPDMLWYQKALALKKHKIDVKDPSDLQGTEKIIVYKPNTKQNIEDRFRTVKIDSFHNVMMYRLEGEK